HADDLRVLQFGRLRIDRTQRAEERTVATEDRHRDVALETVQVRRRVAAEIAVLRDVVDDDRIAAGADGIADCRLNLQLATGFQPERDLIAYRAGDPAILGD